MEGFLKMSYCDGDKCVIPTTYTNHVNLDCHVIVANDELRIFAHSLIVQLMKNLKSKGTVLDFNVKWSKSS